MTGLRVVFVGAVFAAALSPGGTWATPPAPGKHFDCSDSPPGTTSCATDDTGCVSDTKDHEKCASAIGKAFSKAVSSVIKCHGRQATARFKGTTDTDAATAEETCENAAKAQLDAARAKVAPICSAAQNSGAQTEETVLFTSTISLSLDAQNSMVFCDNSSGQAIGGDETGSVPSTSDNLKCALTVGKMVSKLAAGGIKCHDKMNKAFFVGKDFDEETCEETDPVSHKGALDKYNQQVTKLASLGICPSCLDTTHLNDLATTAISQLDAGNSVGNPCP